MKFLPTELPGVIVVEPDLYRDARGFFLETYHGLKYREGGIDVTFVQDNHSRSTRGSLRGLHAQLQRPQGKLVRVLQGEVFDVAVDIRRGSPTFLRWVAVTLSAENFRQCYIPPGFAHGFCVTTDYAEFEYKCTDYYDPTSELRILWNDPAIGIVWPVREPILSDKDRAGRPVADLMERLPLFAEASLRGESP
jgi:dTDP-4-dehydrorhamnose 3,5-epimerase